MGWGVKVEALRHRPEWDSHLHSEVPGSTVALEPIALPLNMGTVLPRLGPILACVWLSSVTYFAPHPLVCLLVSLHLE